MATDQKEFRWRDVGDLDVGRPNLGGTIRLEMYRVLMLSVQYVLERKMGKEASDEIVREAGRTAGAAFRRHFLPPTEDKGEYIRDLQAVLRTMGAGVMRVEQIDLSKGSVILTLSEDMGCSGRTGPGRESFAYDEGFLAAIIEGFAGKPYEVREVNSWSREHRTCRFVAKPKE